jgi:gamma-glutamyltranspeptidase/glutathione hydrolase
MAAALKLVAAQGAKAVYEGAIAQAILKTSQRLGGKLTAADLAEFESEWVEPISTEYHGWKVYELPPNGQGITALEMLNLFSLFPMANYAPRGAEELHTQIEAQKLAYTDLRKYVADPRYSKVPVAGMLSMDYARGRAKLIDPHRAGCDVSAGTPPVIHGDTIYLSVVDRDGNIVSLIQSLYEHFGSAVVVDGYGFALQNRGGLFEVNPDHPNALAPRKRPYHTIIPGFLAKGDRHIAFGIMRGMNQAQAQAQFVSNVVDHGMNIQAALEAPRFTKMTLGGCDVQVEGRVPAATCEELKKRGHALEVLGDYSGLVGGGQAVMRDAAAGVKYGASSPRKDGAAIPEPDPYFN